MVNADRQGRAQRGQARQGVGAQGEVDRWFRGAEFVTQVEPLLRRIPERTANRRESFHQRAEGVDGAVRVFVLWHGFQREQVPPGTEERRTRLETALAGVEHDDVFVPLGGEGVELHPGQDLQIDVAEPGRTAAGGMEASRHERQSGGLFQE